MKIAVLFVLGLLNPMSAYAQVESYLSPEALSATLSALAAGPANAPAAIRALAQEGKSDEQALPKINSELNKKLRGILLTSGKAYTSAIGGAQAVIITYCLDKKLKKNTRFHVEGDFYRKDDGLVDTDGIAATRIRATNGDEDEVTIQIDLFADGRISRIFISTPRLANEFISWSVSRDRNMATTVEFVIGKLIN